MSATAFDHDMMAIALRMAERGLGQTAPNPAVGAVIADEASGEVIARGWTQPGGRPHAETEAIRCAGNRARGATLYVTLEPCAHHGKTPPCADAIIAAGLKRVVVGTGDPDPRTAGQGIARLRAAGIEVVTGVREAEARWVTLGHILRVTEHRPFVQVKMALNFEGSVPRGDNGHPTIVTGPEARAAGHMLRARVDAILVGASTVRDDDPLLTCRLPGLQSRSPTRIVMTSDGEGIVSSKLALSARDVPLWIFCGPDLSAENRLKLEDMGARVFQFSQVGRRLHVKDVAGCLAEEGITRLLVEGGPMVWQSFGSARMVDEVHIFHAPLRNVGLEAPCIEKSAMGAARSDLPGLKFTLTDRRVVGSDMQVCLRRTGA